LRFMHFDQDVGAMANATTMFGLSTRLNQDTSLAVIDYSGDTALVFQQDKRGRLKVVLEDSLEYSPAWTPYQAVLPGEWTSWPGGYPDAADTITATAVWDTVRGNQHQALLIEKADTAGNAQRLHLRAGPFTVPDWARGIDSIVYSVRRSNAPQTHTNDTIAVIPYSPASGVGTAVDFAANDTTAGKPAAPWLVCSDSLAALGSDALAKGDKFILEIRSTLGATWNNWVEYARTLIYWKKP